MRIASFLLFLLLATSGCSTPTPAPVSDAPVGADVADDTLPDAEFDGGSEITDDAGSNDIAVDALNADTGDHDATADGGTEDSVNDSAEADMWQPEDVTSTDVIDDLTAEDAPSGDVGDAVEDTLPPLDTASDDAGPGSLMICEPVGVWTVFVESASGPGDGCGPDGVPGQSPSTHVFAVMADGEGGYVATMIDGPDPAPVVSVVFSDGENGCLASFLVTAEVYFPAGNGAEGGTVKLEYAYDLVEENGVFTGAGTVSSSYLTDSGVLTYECVEPLTVSGVLGEAVETCGPGEWGDGSCDAGLNVFECGWDGGDCCETTCEGADCGGNAFDCQNPIACENMLSNCPTVDPTTYTLDVSSVTSNESGQPVTGNLLVSPYAVAGFPVDLTGEMKVIDELAPHSVFEGQTLSACVGNPPEVSILAIPWGDSGFLHLQPGHPLLTNLSNNDTFKPTESAHISAITAAMPYEISQNEFTYIPGNMCFGVRIPGVGWLWNFYPQTPVTNDFIKFGGITFNFDMENVDMMAILVEKATGFSTLSYAVEP